MEKHSIGLLFYRQAYICLPILCAIKCCVYSVNRCIFMNVMHSPMAKCRISPENLNRFERTCDDDDVDPIWFNEEFADAFKHFMHFMTVECENICVREILCSLFLFYEFAL